MPVAVPGVEHREAALAEAADHEPARPRHGRGAGDTGRRTAAARRRAVKELERPLIGDEAAYGVIDPDVLWSCTTCGACVNQCPVDIEHVDHIVDMRRYQVLVESNFPAELNQLFRGPRGQGQPLEHVGPGPDGLGEGPRLRGAGRRRGRSSRWSRSTGCSGSAAPAPTRTAPRRRRARSPSCSHLADVSFGVLGNGETCTGDPARRAGNEFVYQGLAAQNIETLTGSGEHQVKQVVTTCAHCFNTLKNEYRDLGLELEVVHHTQLLNRLVREGRLDPGRRRAAGAAKRTITYHDPCYLGRHNQVYSPPRELLQVLPGASYVEMERSQERSFCCGAGGARMWMEENLGERINTNRTKEAVATGADQIAVGCPFCRVMLSDGLTAEQADGRRPRGGRGARRRADAAGVGEGRVGHPHRRHGAPPAARPSRPRPSPSRATRPRRPRRSPRPPTSGPPRRRPAARRCSTSDDDDEPEAAASVEPVEPTGGSLVRPEPERRARRRPTEHGRARRGRRRVDRRLALRRRARREPDGPSRGPRRDVSRTSERRRLALRRRRRRAETRPSPTAGASPSTPRQPPRPPSTTGSLFDLDDDSTEPSPRRRRGRSPSEQKPEPRKDVDIARGRLALRPVTPL